MDPQLIFVIVVLLIFVALVVYLRRSGAEPPDIEPRAKEPVEAEPTEAVKPTKALDDRMEVEEAVEIHDGMSLAEIKKAKAARVKAKKKSKRATAVEATEAARKEYAAEKADEEPEEPEEAEAAAEEADEPVAEEDVDAGWDLLDEDDDDLGLSFEPSKPTPAEISEAEPEPEEEPAEEPEPEEPAVEEPAVEEPVVEEPEPSEPVVEEPVGLDQMSESLGTPLSEGLARTRSGFIAKLSKLFRREELDENIVEELEEVLYTADIGPKAATDILGAVEDQLSGDAKHDPEAVWAFVREYVEELLARREEKLDLDSANPFVILVIGVNGVGKTTTIGKMAAKFKRAGKKVLLVAGDTFRAAAVEQIEVWGDRADIPVHTGAEKADPASVVFSGVERAQKEGFDVVICDTAGRLHTNAPLLDELEKMSRVSKKVIDDAPHETILVLDANTGQNAIQQAKMFREAVPITGIVLTKLDGTAKGGVILGICDELDAPIRYIGIGESVADLRQFDAAEFTEALFM